MKDIFIIMIDGVIEEVLVNDPGIKTFIIEKDSNTVPNHPVEFIGDTYEVYPADETFCHPQKHKALKQALIDGGRRSADQFDNPLYRPVFETRIVAADVLTCAPHSVQKVVSLMSDNELEMFVDACARSWGKGFECGLMHEWQVVGEAAFEGAEFDFPAYWKITEGCIEEEEASELVSHPHIADVKNSDLPYAFRLCGKEGDVLYSGRAAYVQGDGVYAPLDKFGTSRGCTKIEYNHMGRWREL